ncbi:methyl-accepting chemotaxis sensory transducer [Candidatus Koribacter versatilis Ellin345]|uniref:Methyl-accepting chemotaxis sensory transducer n=1 Tax=Koribacter versatilis (strain Ellin345) TaxID=204669 RepID=Q1IQS5_KORVE|nr:methyl-accepting chemotaxis protein [Candidatus Koribacter versatilis]ABF40775.1 methyl-accepting chemotaxis sensory transducer [Candidatus Koribacter versatilis Ellin345]
MTGRNTIRKRLMISFGAIIALVVVLFIASFLSVMRERSAKAAAQTAIDMQSAIEKLRMQMMENRVALAGYVLTGGPAPLAKFNSGVEEFDHLLSDARSKAYSEGQRTALKELEDRNRNWKEKFALPLIQVGKSVEMGNATATDVQLKYITVSNEWAGQPQPDEALDNAERDNAQELTQRRERDSTSSLVTLVASAFVALIAVLAGLFIARRTAKSIVDPIDALNKMAGEIGESGDLEHTVEIERDDEVGDLAKTFNSMVTYLTEMASTSEAIAGGDLTVDVRPRSSRDTLGNAFLGMTEGLRMLVGRVRDSAAQVAAGSNQVADASDESAKISVQASSAIDEVTSTMHEMSVNVQNMVKNTQMQASNVSETSASIDQMVASIQRVADTAKVLLDISNKSREEVHSGITTMTKATDGLGRINTAIQSSSDIIDALGQRADDIGKIIEVIDDLAEQTNLLALNAAIEAARAGEHGLGFAVVADEVRKLAEKSAQSTKEISDLIQSIQKEARKAVENMEKSTTIVNEGLMLGNELSVALKKISTVVTEVYKFAQEIGAATNEQSHGSSQIARATTRLNEITHEINSAVEEQAGGAQQVVRAMERMRELIQQSTSGSTELAASAEQMSKMSRQLLDAMDRFIIDTISGVGRNGNRGQESNADRISATRYAATARS